MSETQDQLDLLGLSVFKGSSDLDNIQDLVKWVVLEEAALLKIKKDYENRKEQLAAVKESIAKIFRAKGIKTHKLSSGLAPCCITTTKFYVKSEVEQEQICQWFEQNNLGESIKRAVNFQTMNSILSDRKEAGEDIPSHLVDYTDRDSLRMNGKPKFLADNKVDIRLPEIKVQNGNIEVK